MSRQDVPADARPAAGPDGGPKGAAGEWHLLRDAELWARVIRVAREDIAYFKVLFESYEGVGLIRTVGAEGDGTVLIAILSTGDFRHETDAILADVAGRGAPPFAAAPLPTACTEDWFLSTWVRDAGE